MRANSKLKTLLLSGLFVFTVAACGNNNKTEDAENAEESKVGEVYNEDKQGVQHENRDNQFNESRNDNTEGTGLETGAPTDTIDGDGDTKAH